MTSLGNFFIHKIPFHTNPLKIRKSIDVEILGPPTFLKPLAKLLHPIRKPLWCQMFWKKDVADVQVSFFSRN